MRIRLSKKGWNNVLIFASMFMILLFNYSHKMMTGNQTAEQIQPLLPEGTLIQSIDFNGIKLERVGATWRILTNISEPDMADANPYLETWQKQPFQTLISPPLMLETAKSLPVVIWVAGQANGWVYEFVIDHIEGTLYVKDHQRGLWYEIEQQYLSQLIPHQLTKP